MDQNSRPESELTLMPFGIPNKTVRVLCWDNMCIHHKILCIYIYVYTVYTMRPRKGPPTLLHASIPYLQLFQDMFPYEF